MKNEYSNEEKIAYFNALLMKEVENYQKAKNEFAKAYYMKRIYQFARIIQRMFDRHILPKL